MSEETDVKTVDEATDDQSVTDSEAGADARDDDDLDQLLSQYEEEQPGASKSEPEAKPGTEADYSRLASEVEALKKQQHEERVAKEVDDLVDQIRGESEVSPRLVRGWLDQIARENPKLANAYFNPNAGTKERQKIQNGLAKEFHKEFSGSRIDPKATEDRAAVTAALRGASKQAPGDDDIDEAAVAKMTDAEFEAWSKTQMK